MFSKTPQEESPLDTIYLKMREDYARIKTSMEIWKHFVYKQREAEFYELKRAEEEEFDYACEHFPDEPQLWCDRCRLGICEDH